MSDDVKIHDKSTDGPLPGGRFIDLGEGRFLSWPEGEPEPSPPKSKKSKKSTKEAAEG